MPKPGNLLAAVGLLAALGTDAQPKAHLLTNGPIPRFEDYRRK